MSVKCNFSNKHTLWLSVQEAEVRVDGPGTSPRESRADVVMG